MVLVGGGHYFHSNLGGGSLDSSNRTMLPTLTEALGTNEFVEASRMKKIKIDKKQKSRYDKHAK